MNPLTFSETIEQEANDTSTINWDELTPPCGWLHSKHGSPCNRTASYVVRWDKCEHYSKREGFNCDDCAHTARKCPYCLTQGYMTILGRL